MVWRSLTMEPASIPVDLDLLTAVQLAKKGIWRTGQYLQPPILHTLLKVEESGQNDVIFTLETNYSSSGYTAFSKTTRASSNPLTLLPLKTCSANGFHDRITLLAKDPAPFWSLVWLRYVLRSCAPALLSAITVNSYSRPITEISFVILNLLLRSPRRLFFENARVVKYFVIGFLSLTVIVSLGSFCAVSRQSTLFFGTAWMQYSKQSLKIVASRGQKPPVPCDVSLVWVHNVPLWYHLLCICTVWSCWRCS